MSELVQYSDGDTIYIGVGQDVSTATSYEMILSNYSGILYKVAILGTAPITIDGISLLANKYVYYVTIEGDIEVAGTWKAQTNIILASNERLSKVITFTVNQSLPQNPA